MSTEAMAHLGIDSMTDLVGIDFYGAYWLDSLNWTIHGREIQLFCYITNSGIVENENASVT